MCLLYIPGFKTPDLRGDQLLRQNCPMPDVREPCLFAFNNLVAQRKGGRREDGPGLDACPIFPSFRSLITRVAE